MYIPDLSARTYDRLGGDGFEYRSVGWLGRHVERKGDTDSTLIHVLLHLAAINAIPNEWLGLHMCEMCETRRVPGGGPADADLPPRDVWEDPMGGGALFVEDGKLRYVLPWLIFHYIIVHRYKLPDVVEAAVRRSAVLTPEAWEAYDRLGRAAVESAYAPQHGQADLAKRLEHASLLRRLRRFDITGRDRQSAIAYQEAKTNARREGHESGVADGLARGKLRGTRSALLRVLASAKISLAKADRARIQACADQRTLDAWLDNVLGAKTAAEVLR
jgi:hypothetical protein